MLTKEIIREATIDPDIKDILFGKGYKLLGDGADQQAWLAPDGTVLKIFGYGTTYKGQLSIGQQSFIDYANYCKQNPNNPFLLQILGYKKFRFKNKTYLQIRTERLFPFNKIKEVAYLLAELVVYIQDFGLNRGYKNFIKKYSDHQNLEIDWQKENAKNFGILVSLVGGEKEFKLLAKTISELNQIANMEGYILDLHAYNFLLGSDGEIVINDPFHVSGSYSSGSYSSGSYSSGSGS
jgi:hypothetical protein